MSCYYMHLKHRVSKEIHKIFAIDDYFAWHVYGYKTPDERVLTQKELEAEYEDRDFTREA